MFPLRLTSLSNFENFFAFIILQILKWHKKNSRDVSEFPEENCTETKTKLNPVEVGNKKYKRSPMEKCPGFGLVFFGEANYSREVNISPGIPDKTIPGEGSLSGNPDYMSDESSDQNSS